ARGGTSSLAKGLHYLPVDLTPQELLARLQRKGAAHVKVVIPEGWNRYDIARRLDALRICTLRSFIEATDAPSLLAELHVEGPSAEGYLFPATYDLELDSEPAAIVRRMVREFDKRWSTLDEKHAAGLLDLGSSLHWGRREVVILASMVEKEAAVDDERATIASVFLNRLRDKTFEPKLLQCDPTAGYGCLVGTSPGCEGFSGKITHEVVADAENLYNTYKHEGLPPGPIGNPGVRSLEAVLAPAMTHYFYFVAKGGGRHTFSETYAAHTAAVRHEDAGTAP
ncbi:MAG TPA: endolytic transglycosylase MltG, partial [Polyangiaceae bacterium]